MTDETPSGRKMGRARPRREPATIDQKPLSVTVEPDENPIPEEDAGTDRPASEDGSRAAGQDGAVAEEAAPAATSPEGTAAPDEPLSPADTAALPEATAPQEAQPQPGEEAVVAMPQPEIAVQEPPAREEHAAARNEDEDPVHAEPQIVKAREPSRVGALIVAVLAGGVAGAAVSAALPYMLAHTGGDQAARFAAIEQSVAQAAPRPEVEAVTRAVDTLRQRAAALEERIGALAAAPAGTPAEGGAQEAQAAVADLQGKVGNLQEQIAASGGQVTALSSRLDERLAAVAAQIGNTEQTITALDPARVRTAIDEQTLLTQRLSGVEATVRDKLGQFDPLRFAAQADTQAGEIARLATRVTAAEGAVGEAERRALAAGAANSERLAAVARLAVIERLREALNGGQPFPAEIDTLTRLGASETALAPLRAVANGVATPSSLVAAFARAAAAFEVVDVPADAGIVDRLAASASRIVRIRPVDGAADPSDIAGQVEALLRRDDAGAAFAAWQRLPDRAREQTKAVGDTLQARVNAQTALAALARTQVEALDAALAAGAARGE
ncbi:hypothetical protein FHS82_001148 [Pseudochelatococcus lubricantis]|uniref:Uncharacterized protein n=1 Tax=Pseudochelatococcus lubricantis TaxID=1538102 RepID=A0ABX0UWK6_9HYPH|nr:hypothetical protein [Pseudochelatococcus lubricantis]NIJ57322.1 hypothetical protein [Pseudochelatococcus lubricantis]